MAGAGIDLTPQDLGTGDSPTFMAAFLSNGDSALTLRSTATGTPGAADDAGVVVERGDSDNSLLGWDEGDDEWKAGTSSDGTVANIALGTFHASTFVCDSGTSSATSVRSGDVNTGLYFFGGAGLNVGVSADGAEVCVFHSGSDGFRLGSAIPVSWASGGAPATASDLFCTRKAAATLHMGEADAAAPVNQTFGVQGARGGTDTDTSGAELTVRSGIGTGAGAASKIVFQTPTVGGSGTTAQTMAARMEVKTTGVNFIGADAAAANTGTLGNAPSAGDPAEWIPIEFNGTTRYIPAWA